MNWITKDWGIKLVSLVLAIGLWYYAVGEESVEIKRIVPLEITVKNPQMSILKSSVRNVWVTLSAPRHLLSEITDKELRAVHEIGADISSAGEYSFKLLGGEIKLPTPQARVVRIVPETIHVTLDELIVQKLKIHPVFVGEPAFGYSLREEEIQIDPNAILLEGPKGQLEKLDSIQTKSIDLIGRIRSVRRTVELDLPPGVKSLSEAVVEIFIPINEEFGEKQFENVSIRVLSSVNQLLPVEIKPSQVSFVLKGSRQSLEKLSSESVFAHVDLTNPDKNQKDYPIKAILPEGVNLKEDVFVTVSFSR